MTRVRTAADYGYTTLAVVGELIEAMREQFVSIPEGYEDPVGGLVPTVEHRGGLVVALDRMWPGGNCQAMAWVNVLSRWTTAEFPTRNPVNGCGGVRVLHVQVGVARCATMVDDHGNIPSIEAEEAQALALLDDADRLALALCVGARRAVDREVADAYQIHEWEPHGPEGGVIASQQTISVQLTNPRLPRRTP